MSISGKILSHAHRARALIARGIGPTGECAEIERIVFEHPINAKVNGAAARAHNLAKLSDLHPCDEVLAWLQSELADTPRDRLERRTEARQAKHEEMNRAIISEHQLATKVRALHALATVRASIMQAARSQYSMALSSGSPHTADEALDALRVSVGDLRKVENALLRLDLLQGVDQ